jgi:hypothetical protein
MTGVSSELFSKKRAAWISMLDKRGPALGARALGRHRGGAVLLRTFFRRAACIADAAPWHFRDQRIFLPRPERTSSTPSNAVRLCSSMMGLISTISMETIASLSAIISMARCASR